MPRETLTFSDATATEAHGHACAARLGSGGAALALTGDLGTGKTTWTRGLARGLGLELPIRSPSYTYRFDYVLPDGRQLVHADLYRVPEGADVGTLGLDELVGDGRTILVIEWAERLPFALPTGAWQLAFSVAAGDTRTLTLSTP